MSGVVPVLDIEGEPHAEVFADGPRTVRLRLDVSVGGESHELATGDAVRFDGDREVSPRAEEPTTTLVVFAPR